MSNNNYFFNYNNYFYILCIMKLPVNYNALTWQERKKCRELYIQVQNGVCYYCKEGLNKNPAKEVLAKAINLKLFPVGFLTYPIHLHHSHDTGLTIGAVHSYCNAVLWQYEGK